MQTLVERGCGLDVHQATVLNDFRLGRKEPNMCLIDVDYHPSFQTIAFFVEESGDGNRFSITGK
jgi:hypothetical protein